MERSKSLTLWNALAVCLLAAMGGCATPPNTQSPQDAQSPADLRNYPQDCTAYLDANSADKPLLSAQRQLEQASLQSDNFFAAWRQDKPVLSIDGVRKMFDECIAKPGFGQNAQPCDPRWAHQLLSLADLQSYPNIRRRGIVVRTGDLRGLPTDRPRFDDFAQAGGGWPFDTLQDSLVWAGTPIFVSHAAVGGAWLLVETPVGFGWMRAQDVAYVADGRILAWQGRLLVAVTTENTPLLTDKGAFWATGRIGMLLPLLGKADGKFTVGVATRGPAGAALPAAAIIDAKYAAVVPMPMTPTNLAAVANQMIGQPYGWGGLYGDRDCSSTLRDLFAPFGMLLPRNSSQQAAVGRVVPLGQLPPVQREKILLEQGRPWLTLVRAPGHIMLYIGSRDGQAMVYQNFWGIKTQAGGREGRCVAGVCGITTLQAGRERTDLLLADQRSRIESIILLEDPATTSRPTSRPAPVKASEAAASASTQPTTRPWFICSAGSSDANTFFSGFMNFLAEPFGTVAILLLIVAGIMYLSELPQMAWFFKFLPGLFWIYFVPMIFNTLGWLPGESAVYGNISKFCLPGALVLLTISVRLGAILRLGPAALTVMLAGSLGIVIGGPVVVAIFHHWLPADAWQGLGCLSGSWIGGSANMIAVNASTPTLADAYKPMPIVDTVVAYCWMGLLIMGANYQRFFPKVYKPNDEMVESLVRRATLDEEARQPLDVRHVAMMFALAASATLIGLGAGRLLVGVCLPWDWAQSVWGTFKDQAWAIILATVLGLAFSFTSVRRLEKFGASKVGYGLLYFVLASMGAGTRLTNLDTAAVLIVAGFVWVGIHASFILIAGRLVRAPMSLLAAASQANIGGTASAPIVAGAYQPMLAPVGLLLAVLGNIIGTGLGIVCWFLCKWTNDLMK